MSTIIIDDGLKKSAHFKRYCEMIQYHWSHGRFTQSEEWLKRLCDRYGFDLNMQQFIAAMSL